MVDAGLEAERLVCCFDPHASLVQGESEHLVISPRWGRLRRNHPLLASAPHAQDPVRAWLAAKENLLTCRDRSIQLAIATYEHRIRMNVCFTMEELTDGSFDLHEHCHSVLDRCSGERQAVTLRRDTFWIRSLAPDPDGYVHFEIGNVFLIPITEQAIEAESRTMLGG
ncbi:MAG TPA: hypothetical protein VHX60_11785 [Acidobacteriaceae bacterium]|jgi:hypothetical protein|nr:hypothetical protein [Acidobacteriaceae bacterium]